MFKTPKWLFEDFVAYAKKTLPNEIGWPSGGGKSVEEKLLDIEHEAAQKIKELLINRAKQLFGDSFPKMKYEIEFREGERLDAEAPGIYVAYSGTEYYADLRDDGEFVPCVRLAKSVSCVYDLSLVMLPDGLYVFKVFNSPTLPILNSSKPARDKHYLLYGEIAFVEIEKAAKPKRA